MEKGNKRIVNSQSSMFLILSFISRVLVFHRESYSGFSQYWSSIFEMTNMLNSYGSKVLLEPSEILFESNSPKYLELF
jgi:hypothetical protein